VNRAEINRAWVRARVKAMGLEEEIGRLAYARFMARYMPQEQIDRKFFKIVGEISE
jgi:hypothetical protein